MSVEILGNEPIPLSLEFKKISNIDVKFPEFATQVSFIFGRHEVASDLPDDLEDHIKSNDVVLLESAGWNQASQEALQAISDGDKSALELRRTFLAAQNDTFGIRLSEAIFHSGKPVRFCDIPHSRKNRELLEQAKATFSLTNIPNFQTFMGKSANQMSALLKYGIYERDKYMIRNLYPIISETLAERTVEEPAKALFIVGGAHKTVAYGIKKQIAKKGLEDRHAVTESFINLSSDYTQRAYYEFLAGKSISEDTVIKSVIERLINIPTDETHTILSDINTEAAMNVYRRLLVKSGFEWASGHQPIEESSFALQALLKRSGYNAD